MTSLTKTNVAPAIIIEESDKNKIKGNEGATTTSILLYGYMEKASQRHTVDSKHDSRQRDQSREKRGKCTRDSVQSVYEMKPSKRTKSKLANFS